MQSVWEQTSQKKTFEQLKGDIKTEVLIIGGGMAGVLCAYLLEQAGVPYALAEAETIGGGVTGKTTAKITSQHGLLYEKLIRTFGAETARLYLEGNEEALARYRTLCGEIDCEFEEKTSYVYSLSDRAVIEKEILALQKLGADAQFAEELSLPFRVAGAVRVPHQAQFHPLKFLYALSEGLHIYEHTSVRELVGMTAVTDHGRIHANQIIVATHFPFLNKHGSYFLKLYQQRSYVIALEHAADVDGIYIDGAENGLSFRNAQDLLLIGGGGHRTGKKGGNWTVLRDFAHRFYPKAAETSRWATQDCMGLDDVPYIGRYSANTPGLYVATGFHKWGMTTSMLAAMILCDLVQGKRNPYVEMFSPSRSILRPQLAVNAWEAAVNLLTPTTKRCPHLSCALKWNACEHTWDCPCHGSRFTKDGKLIDNPATGDLKM